jgi:hypothetical protein
MINDSDTARKEHIASTSKFLSNGVFVFDSDFPLSTWSSIEELYSQIRKNSFICGRELILE